MAFPSLAGRLPPVRGKLIENAPLAGATWLRVGGPAQALFLPADEPDLARFLAETPNDVPVTVLGAASNTLVRDGGVPGVVVRLTAAFGRVEAVGAGRLRAGAAALDRKVAGAAADAGVAGLEFLVGVPGAIGGAVRMNAGCYGREMRDVLVEAVALDRAGRRLIAPVEEFGYRYRSSAAPPDWIVVEALLQGAPDEPEAIAARMAAITARREESQPIREKTGGSTFKNPDPPGTANQRKAWELIDAAGGRGLQVGGARMSDQHCNFMINTGEAAAADLEALGEEVRRRVRETSGVELEWEIKRIGAPAGEEGAGP
ncbi:MAG: UDP-N-acetylmuramate dehydrogenase [Caulobacterales bacterium]|nr:UDP-N-acetylmuramate dehydrogenase [Caulobacterales bacterium]